MAVKYFFGHRGYSAIYPENTIMAFEEAVNEGVCGFELDIAKSADGVLFCMHNNSVDATTDGTGNCNQLNWDYIETLDAGSWKDLRFSGEGVPSFEEVLDYFKDKNCFILAEIKDGYTGIASDVANMVTEKGMEKQVFLQSFNWDYMTTVKSINPNLKTGLLGDPFVNIYNRAIADGHDFLALSSIIRGDVHICHRDGLEVFIWTINTMADIQSYINLSVDGIIGDHADFFMSNKNINKILQERPSFSEWTPAVFKTYDDGKWRKAKVKIADRRGEFHDLEVAGSQVLE